MNMRAMGILARREMRGTLRIRWFWLQSLAFGGLSAGLAWMTAAVSLGTAVPGYSRTAAGLVNLALLTVPLMGLVAGAVSLAGERERHTLGFLLAQPVTRRELFFGKFLGVGAALAAGLLLSFGAAGAALGWQGHAVPAPGFAGLVGLTILLSLAALSAGLLISALARQVSSALAAALLAWFAATFLADLGLMGTAVIGRLPARTLLAAAMLNPVQVYKIAALGLLQPSLDILGPLAMYARDRLGAALVPVMAATLAGWVLTPLVGAYAAFGWRDAA